MAASTAAREAARKEGVVVSYPVQAGVKINKGTQVSVDNTGYLRPARSGTATDAFAGVAYEGVDNTLGAAGAVSIRVFKTGTFIFPKNAATAQTDLGQPFYAADDQTLTTTAANNQLTGYCEAILDAVNIRIRIDRAVQ